MQQRHQNRYQYFQELANTSREYYLNYLRDHVKPGPSVRILEIGCGEGGNLLPFAEAGCQVTGIDISEGRIEQARQYFMAHHVSGSFLSQDFLEAVPPKSEAERYDLVLMHDVIEHIEPPFKERFLAHIKPFLKQGGHVFIGFPAWQMPFGGHQQISRGLASKLPYIHLLPNPVYLSMIRMSGNSKERVEELRSVKRARMPIERFERLAHSAGFRIAKRTLWLINPHYKQKFNLRPRLLWHWAASLPYVRNFYTTSAFYLLEDAEE